MAQGTGIICSEVNGRGAAAYEEEPQRRRVAIVGPGSTTRDALPLIGEEQLIKDFFKTRPQHLVSIKCKPYHYADKALILGDAAHAMVPYYGQGMNAGMEDVTLLTSILGQPLPLDEALAQFTEDRWKDAFAICDLAMYNYVEMRDLTKRWSFRCRKWLDTLLFRLFPGWIPLYNSVSFSSMPYSECIANRKWQDGLLKRIFGGSLLAVVLAGSACLVQRFLSPWTVMQSN
ncbi:GL11242 [Drosophila persimilis]|uniref:GL11242 n=1 Tax=Drosophila persimilis TaxID=7234 RepID=B4GDK9_DROPE|nr:GL11242 [Drosophila persimilis]